MLRWGLITLQVPTGGMRAGPGQSEPTLGSAWGYWERGTLLCSLHSAAGWRPGAGCPHLGHHHGESKNGVPRERREREGGRGGEGSDQTQLCVNRESHLLCVWVRAEPQSGGCPWGRVGLCTWWAEMKVPGGVSGMTCCLGSCVACKCDAPLSVGLLLSL